MFVILFVSCTTSIQEQQDHQRAAYGQALQKASQPLLAHAKPPKPGMLPSLR
ncbi:MAG: hypothetical protein ACO1O1_10570 [Adhaeribacter sp.]